MDRSPKPIDVERLAAEIAAAAERAVLARLGTSREIQAALDAAWAVIAVAQAAEDHFKDLVPEAPPLACRKGCGHCCNTLLVRVHPLDGLLMIAEMMSTFDAAAMARVRERISAGRTPCPMLIDEACGIYRARPHVCRTYYSFDLADCHAGNYCERGSGAAEANRFVRHRHHLQQVCGAAARVGANRACAQLGLDNRETHIDSLLRTLVNEPDAAERWLRGERVFPVAESE